MQQVVKDKDRGQRLVASFHLMFDSQGSFRTVCLYGWRRFGDRKRERKRVGNYQTSHQGDSRRGLPQQRSSQALRGSSKQRKYKAPLRRGL